MDVHDARKRPQLPLWRKGPTLNELYAAFFGLGSSAPASALRFAPAPSSFTTGDEPPRNLFCKEQRTRVSKSLHLRKSEGVGSRSTHLCFRLLASVLAAACDQRLVLGCNTDPLVVFRSPACAQ